MGGESDQGDGKAGREISTLKSLNMKYPPEADCVFEHIFIAKRLENIRKKTKKKQLYRYSQSRWNTNIVVSSISKIKEKSPIVKLADLN